jgi:hypothetical protein
MSAHSEADTNARIDSFEEFWPFYVSEHRDPLNRALHYASTTMVIGTVVTAAVTMNPAWLLLAPVVGYGPAWVGHFFIENNKPASFKHPLWSLRGDFKMYAMALRGKMADEVERICAERDAATHARSNVSSDHAHAHDDSAGAQTNGHAAAHS